MEETPDVRVQDGTVRIVPSGADSAYDVIDLTPWQAEELARKLFEAAATARL